MAFTALSRLPASILAAAVLVTCAGQLRALPQPLTCDINAGVPPIVRASGITELLGDIILNCTGGTSTTAGAPVPLSNFQLSLNTNLTSRTIGSSGLSEATLMIDEPLPPLAARIPDSSFFVPVNSPPPQVLCLPQGGSCPIMGDGLGTPYETIPGTPTVFSGRQLSANSVSWVGLAFDAPGNSPLRVIRITNLRANASLLGLGSSLIPTQIVAFITVTGAQSVTINDSQVTVGFIDPDLIVTSTPGAAQQCVSQNSPLSSPNFSIAVKEGFASLFKRRNVSNTLDGATAPPVRAQNIPGFPYNVETQFYNPVLFPQPLASQPGLADFGDRIRITFSNIPTGVAIYVPLQIPLLDATTGLPSPILQPPPPPVPPGIPDGRLVLIQTDGFGVGPASSYLAAPSAGVSGGVPVGAISPSATPGQGFAVYEVVNGDINSVEKATIPVTVAFASAGAGLITANVSLAPAGGPLAGIPTDDATAPLPRFADSSVPMKVYSVGICTQPGQQIGFLDIAGNSLGGSSIPQGATLFAGGWAADTTAGAPVQSVTILVDGNSVGTGAVNGPRPDVAQAYNRTDFTSSGWGFQVSTAALSLGPHSVTASAKGPSGTGMLTGTRNITITAPAGQEIGFVDQAGDLQGLASVTQGATLYVRGWAADTASGAPVQTVTIYVDGNSVGNATLGTPRGDVVLAFSRSDYVLSGWSFQVSSAALSVGTHVVTAIATGSSGSAALTGSRTVNTTLAGGHEIGVVDLAGDSQGVATVAQGAQLHVGGWAADTATGAPVQSVNIFVDGNNVGFAGLGVSRPDVAQAFSRSDYTNSGWSFQMSSAALSVGQHSVGATATGISGTVQLVNSRTVNITAGAGQEIGFVDMAGDVQGGATVSQAGTLYVRGWAADTATGAPVQSVTLFLDGNSMGTATLGGSRPDVASAFSRSDYTNSGWSFQISAGSLSIGQHSITASAAGSSGTGPLLRTKTINVTP